MNSTSPLIHALLISQNWLGVNFHENNCYSLWGLNTDLKNVDFLLALYSHSTATVVTLGRTFWPYDASMHPYRLSHHTYTSLLCRPIYLHVCRHWLRYTMDVGRVKLPAGVSRNWFARTRSNVDLSDAAGPVLQTPSEANVTRHIVVWHRTMSDIHGAAHTIHTRYPNCSIRSYIWNHVDLHHTYAIVTG